MKSYILHLQAESEVNRQPSHGDDDMGDQCLLREKRRVLARSLSDPLLAQPEGITIRRGRKRPPKRPSSASFDEEFNVMKSSSTVNACPPRRRGSINHQEKEVEQPKSPPTTLRSAIQAQYNAPRPSRRGSMARTKSCPDMSPRKARRSVSKENLRFRAEILCNALNDMGLFDDDSESFLSSNPLRTTLPLAPVPL